VVAFAGVTAGLEALAGLMRGLRSFSTVILAVGITAVILDTVLSTHVQLVVDEAFRGRVLSVLRLVSMGGSAVRAPMLGLLADLAAARAGAGQLTVAADGARTGTSVPTWSSTPAACWCPSRSASRSMSTSSAGDDHRASAPVVRFRADRMRPVSSAFPTGRWPASISDQPLDRVAGT
jgi:hypothetical protein